MENKILQLALPELDGKTAVILIGIINNIADQLWFAYGDEIFHAVDHEPPPLPENPDDYPF